MLKSKVSAIASLLLVFFSGAALGAVAYRLYMANPVQSVDRPTKGGGRPNPEEFRKKYVEDFRSKVKLDDQQIARVEQILDQTRSEFHQMRDKMNAEGAAIQNGQVAKINAILRDDQRPLYEAFRAERERQRKLQHDQHKKQ